MQGRLSPRVGGRIQAFPCATWREEFPVAERLGLRIMEWTLDQERLRENPLLTSPGRDEILALCEQHGVAVPSVTGDCFMQAPFWKVGGREGKERQSDFDAVVEASAHAGIAIIVVPLVDNGRIESDHQGQTLVAFCEDRADVLSSHGLCVAFESDFEPDALGRFIARLDPGLFGVNYDMGNSAALGFNAEEEMSVYGDRVINVHVKDRLRGGMTVPLGTGSVEFPRVFAALAGAGYAGNYILQTAWAENGDHANAVGRYRDMTINWLHQNAA